MNPPQSVVPSDVTHVSHKNTGKILRHPSSSSSIPSLSETEDVNRPLASTQSHPPPSVREDDLIQHSS